MTAQKLFANGIGLLGSYGVSFLSFWKEFQLMPFVSEFVGIITALVGSFLTYALAKQHLANARKVTAQAKKIEIEVRQKEFRLKIDEKHESTEDGSGDQSH